MEVWGGAGGGNNLFVAGAKLERATSFGNGKGRGAGYTAKKVRISQDPERDDQRPKDPDSDSDPDPDPDPGPGPRVLERKAEVAPYPASTKKARQPARNTRSVDRRRCTDRRGAMAGRAKQGKEGDPYRWYATPSFSSLSSPQSPSSGRYG